MRIVKGEEVGGYRGYFLFFRGRMLAIFPNPQWLVKHWHIGRIHRWALGPVRIQLHTKKES